MAHLMTFGGLKLHSYMETSPAVNNMLESNRMSVRIYIFEIRNQHDSFPIFILLFSFSVSEIPYF